MHILRLIFTCFLSLAILSVGSAAVAMSVNSPCAMMQVQDQHADMAKASMSMMSMDMSDSHAMPHMDCMKVDKSHSGNPLHCKSGQDCVMYNVQLANLVSNLKVDQPKPQYLNTQHNLTQSFEFVPTPDLFGLWRPPRAL